MVSIVVAVFNHEKYIDQAIQGFLAQKVNFKIEILINDDASTDRSAERITEYQKKYPDVFRVFLQSENQYSKGKKPWFNVLFPNSRGKYIAICEGDDYWTDPNKLQEQIDFLENNPQYSAAAHNAVVCFDDGAKRLFRDDILSPIDLDVKDVIDAFYIPTASLVFRNNLSLNDWEVIDGWVVGDIPLAIVLAHRGPVYLDSLVRSVYRKHKNGASIVNTDKTRIGQTSIELVNMYIALNKYFDSKYRSDFKKAITRCLRRIEVYESFEDLNDLWFLLTVYHEFALELERERNGWRDSHLAVPSSLRSKVAIEAYSCLRSIRKLFR